MVLSLQHEGREGVEPMSVVKFVAVVAGLWVLGSIPAAIAVGRMMRLRLLPAPQHR